MSRVIAMEEQRLPDKEEMARLLDSLLIVLNKEVEVYEELRAIIIEKRSVLAKPALELLAESNNKMETCVLKGKMLEEVRSNLVKKIAHHLNEEERDINITMLVSHADADRAMALKSRQEILMSLIKSINEADGKNRELLDYSLAQVKNSIDFISNILSTGSAYADSGKLRMNGRRGRILNREG